MPSPFPAGVAYPTGPSAPGPAAAAMQPAPDEAANPPSRIAHTRYASRALRFPDNADMHNVDAKMENGVLKICIAKSGETGSRKIKIGGGQQQPQLTTGQQQQQQQGQDKKKEQQTKKM